MVPPFLASVPTFKSEISQSQLNIENKERSNLFAWNGQFSPQLIEVLLKTYATKHATVLDPFAGSGTVLYECGLEHLNGIAAEINPSAFAMARLYGFINLHLRDRKVVLDNVEGLIEPALPCFFSYSKEPQLGGLGPLGDLSRIARMASGRIQDMIEAFVIISDVDRKGADSLWATWSKIRKTVEGFPFSEMPLSIFNCDARKLPLESESVDLVITSPPYINVFNYHQQYRSGAEALGWDVLSVAKSEIGSNRKHRGNRFLTVIQYCLDITAVLTELERVCKQAGHAIFVVGRESSVRGTRFYNGEIVARLATECAGLNLDFRQERVFQNRFGQSIVEDLLHFKCEKSNRHRADFIARDGRHVAEAFMRTALNEASEPAVIEDLEDALSCLNNVATSPLFDLSQSRIEAQDQCHSQRRTLTN